jgi:5'-nucleotidase
MNDRPLILITNDDGVSAKGLKELTEVMRLFGDVVVVAPEKHMSGMSNAITVDLPIRVTKMVDEEGFEVFKCTGTPVDCVKLAINQLLVQKPDFVVSGINHGANSSISVMYSGTMGGALEGCIHGIPSIGFSLADYDPEADFSRAKIYVARVFQQVAEKGLPKFVCLNVNIPKGEIRGIEVCRQTAGKWVEEFDKRTDPHKRDYFWLAGYFENHEEEDASGGDIAALQNGYVSVVPVNADMTCYQTYETMKSWKF